VRALWVLSAAFVAVVPACRADVPAQRPAAVDSDGDGVPDDADLCPQASEDRNGFEDWDGCPEPDTDHDGVPDPKDDCPTKPEDRDGFADADGCPDPDNDQDLILDANDKCPNEPEVYNAFEDDDGCPDRAPFVALAPETRFPSGLILFDDSSAKIRSDAAAALDAILAFVNDHHAFRGITIAGHAAAYENRPPALAAARAEAVRRYLVERGVPARMIRITPFGAETSPCERSDGRCDSRRVDVGIGIGG
jgi:OOP family OmpA-OmpF porin